MAQINVLGGELQPCSLDPLTGYYRTGCCENHGDDPGVHVICVVMTDEFLAYSKSVGNDLSTPMPQYGFAGLHEGDQWCLCAPRWQEAFEAGSAPKVRLAATHVSALEHTSLADLRAHAVDGVTVLGLDGTRAWLALQIRSRVVGDDPAAKNAEIFDAPGPRLFAEGSPIRTVHADTAMFIGGLRALLLQSLHPLAMAGVAEHSDYRADPWGRLQRTADFLAATTFGTIETAQRAVAIVGRVHERVVGVTADGRPYSANDPHLLHWVHLAEADSFLSAHQRYGRHPLSPSEQDRYLAESAVIARQLGVEQPPVTVRMLRSQLAQFRPELRGTREAREAARFLLIEPPLPLTARPAYLALAAASVALLPAWTRWPLRLPFLPISERLLIGPAGEMVTGMIRWSMSSP